MRRPLFSRRTSRRQRGVSLVEVLVAVLILSLGLLGMAGLQARALKGNVSAAQRTQAVMLSYYMLDALRVDRAGATALAYNTVGFVCAAAGFSDDNLEDNTREHWMNSLKATLGDAASTCGSIVCEADGDCTVSVRWDDSLAGGLGTQTVATSTRI